MKNLYFLLCLCALTVSCGGDDDSNTTPGNDVSTTDYLPMDNGNYWVYDTQNSFQQGRDSLYITGDVVINGITYKKFTTPQFPFGFYSSGLYNNGVRKDGDKLVVSGVANLGFSEEFPLSVPISDLVIFKETTTAGQQLGTTSGTITQPYEGYDIRFDYVLTTKAIQDLQTYTVGQDTYTNVKQVQTILNVKVSTMLTVQGFSYNAEIMQAQDVVVSNQYYAENIGVVHVSTDINFQLRDFSSLNIQLPLPQTGSDHQEEVLDKYSVE